MPNEYGNSGKEEGVPKEYFDAVVLVVCDNGTTPPTKFLRHYHHTGDGIKVHDTNLCAEEYVLVGEAVFCE